MKQVIVSTAFALCIAGVLPGCATGRSTQFPSAEELDQLAARPPPALSLEEVPPQSAEWTLTGPFPPSVAPTPHPADTVFERAFLPALAGAQPALETNGNLACLAREAGLYRLDHPGTVPSVLLSFMAGQCQVGTVDVAIDTLCGDAAADLSDEALATAWSDEVAATANRIAALKDASRAGVWAGRKDGKACAAIARAGRWNRADRVEAVTAVPEVPGAFEVRGQVDLADVERISGWMNRGTFGAVRCVSDPAVLPPKYAMRCEGAREDANAWIEVASFQKDRILGERAAMVLVSPGGAPDHTFRWTPTSASAETEPPTEGFVREVNRARAHAGLQPLTLHPKQSATAARVAPHFFDAVLRTHDEKVQDVIALGLMAGWDMPELLIQSGSFFSAFAGTRNVADLVSAGLLYPHGRAALLDPKARTLAVGSVGGEEERGMGVLASAYVMVEERPLQEQAAQVIAELNRARAAKGLEPATWVASPGTSAEDALRIVTEDHDPEAGLDTFLSAVAHAAHAPMSGWRMRVFDLEDIRFPPQVVMTPKLSVVVAVTPYRAPREPWGGYVILLVLPDAANVKRNETVWNPVADPSARAQLSW